MNISNNSLHRYKELMDDLYSHPKFPDAVDLFASFFAETEGEIRYSNWRHLNSKRQNIENRIWRRLIRPGDKILDIGCGRGFFLKRLYDNFGASIEYYGIDISPFAIREAQEYFRYPHYFVGPAEALPFNNNSFDFVQIISTIENIVSPRLAIREISRVLKDTGYLYIVIHKKCVDPLLLHAGYKMLKKIVRKQEKTVRNQYDLSLSLVWKEIISGTKESNLKIVTRNDLVSHIKVTFYQKLHVPIPFLLGVAALTNNLPIPIFKNLEYVVYQK